MNLFFTLGISFFASLFHPLHVSVTEIEYDQKEKELEVMVRIFTDDLEKALREEQNLPDLDILNPQGKTTDQLLSLYLSAHLKISLDNTLQQQRYLGHEEEGQALICYIQVPNIKRWKTIEVMDDIMMGMYDDQSNLVHVTVNGNVKSMRLVPDEPSGKLTFTP